MPSKTTANTKTKTRNGGNALTDTVQRSITGVVDKVGSTVSSIGTMAGNLVGGAVTKKSVVKKPAVKKPVVKKPVVKKPAAKKK